MTHTNPPDNIEEKHEVKSSKTRSLAQPWKTILRVLCVILATFHLACAGLGTIDTWVIVGTHLGIILLIVYMLYPFKSGVNLADHPSIPDMILGLAGALSCAYIVIFIPKIMDQMGEITTVDFYVGVVAILVVLEAGRRVLGKALPIVAIVFICYGFLGRYVPGVFKHSGYSAEEIVNILFATNEGLWGQALQTSAAYVVLFILFGSIMSKIGMTTLLTDFALGTAGWLTGGPAKVATVSSGLLGTISGSVSANVATTGVMTIPLMKSVGYMPAYAGAVECVASAGGQIMPPVMGAAAFLMAQFLGVPYSTIVIGALTPALLYYFCVWSCVDLRARSRGLKTISRDQVPPLSKTLKNYGHLSLPLFALIYFLVVKQFSPIYSAWLSILLAVAISFCKKHTRLNIKLLFESFEAAIRNTISVAIACATAGFIIGMISLTGFGLVFSYHIITLSFGKLFLTLIFGMIASIILGMGLPTTPCYIVTALTIAPALMKMGVEPLAAHLFVFYFAIMSTLTPPVAISSYVAAGLAGASPVKTGIIGFRLAIAGFLIPYMMIYKPEILMQGTTFYEAVFTITWAVIVIFGVAVASEGYLFGKIPLPLRLLLIASIPLSFTPGAQGLLIIIAALAGIGFFQKTRQKKELSADLVTKNGK